MLWGLGFHVVKDLAYSGDPNLIFQWWKQLASEEVHLTRQQKVYKRNIFLPWIFWREKGFSNFFSSDNSFFLSFSFFFFLFLSCFFFRSCSLDWAKARKKFCSKPHFRFWMKSFWTKKRISLFSCLLLDFNHFIFD